MQFSVQQGRETLSKACEYVSEGQGGVGRVGGVLQREVGGSLEAELKGPAQSSQGQVHPASLSRGQDEEAETCSQPPPPHPWCLLPPVGCTGAPWGLLALRNLLICPFHPYPRLN